MSNHNEISSFIMNVCDDVLRGLFKQHEYGDVILPFVVLRRLDCVLEVKKDDIIKVHQEYKDKFDDTSKIIHSKLNLKFSNYSRYDLRRLKDEPNKISENLYEYLSSFSSNVKDIIKNFELKKHIDKLESNNKLFLLVEKFTHIDLHPSVVDNQLMGILFEELLRQFSEMSNETSGEHYTPKDVVELLVSVMFSSEKKKLSTENKIISIYDPCCGTGGMLTMGKKWINDKINDKIDINLFGQELNPQTYSVCKSDFLITNEEPENIKLGSTLSNDKFSENRKFDFIISNPPYGVNWGSESKFILNESNELNGRFKYGVPSKSDGQLLFLQHMISKMEPSGSKIGVVHNGSPLFSGKSGSGESEIRKKILGDDLLECIIRLPDGMFFNTSQTTYILILNNKKENKRKNKIQLIDGKLFFSRMRKNLNKKNKYISKGNIGSIVELYNDYTEGEESKIFENNHFGYKEFYVYEKILDENNKEILNKKGIPKLNKNIKDVEFISLSEDLQNHIENNIKPHRPTSHWYVNKENIKEGYRISFEKEFPEKIKEIDLFQTKKELNEIQNNLKELNDKLLQIEGEIDLPENKNSPNQKWKTKKIKYFTKVRKDVSTTGQEELLSVSEYTGVYPTRDGKKEDEHLSRSESLVGYNKVSVGELVSNIMLTWKRGLGVSKHEGIVSPSYSVFEFIDGLPEFYHYLFRSDDYINTFKQNSRGVIDSRLRLYDDEFGNLDSKVPTVEEQKKIVDYIGDLENIIEKITELETRKIKLLKKYKNLVINNIVNGKQSILK